MDDLLIGNDNVIDLPRNESRGADGVGHATIDAVLQAFQVLQMRNAHASSHVASSLNIGRSDLRALLFISRAGEATPKQVGAFLELTSGAVTNLIDRISEAGFIQRMPHPNDRRSVVLMLAPAGAESVSRVLGFYREAFERAVPAERMESFTDTLNAVSTSLLQATTEEIHSDSDSSSTGHEPT
jgi:DNA-binding MarR family transcriptional regulator